MVKIGILKTLIQVLQDIAILIGQVILMIERAPLEVVFILKTILYLGTIKNKTQFLYLLLRVNVLLLIVVVLILWLNQMLEVRIFLLYIVIIQVL